MRIARVALVACSFAAGALTALLLPPSAGAARNAPEGPGAAAAGSFLASLPEDLRRQATFPFDSPERRAWYFVPRERVGVSLLKLDDEQSELLGPMLATALSPEGLLTARGVIKHENILRRVETAAGVANASRRDPGLYYASVFGKPADAAPWGWRFEGHHLSINVTQLSGEPPVVGPVFMGANPARVMSGPETGFRLLADEEDLGRALMTLLPEDRRKLALINDTAFSDIVTGNDPAVSLKPEGLPASQMNPEERRQLRRLIELYVQRLAPASASQVLLRLDRAGFEKVRFAWAGSIESGQKHYYRVHGPTLLIEYDNTQNDANHIHTVYRDLERDFGGDVLRRHVAQAHSHLSAQ